MICCIFQFLTGCRCCNRICCQRRQRPVCNLGSLNFIPSVSRPTATQELRSVQANLSTGAGVVLSPGETIGFDSLIANQNKNVYYDYTTGELVINSTGNFLASWWVGIGSAAGGTPCVSVYQNGGSIATSCLPSSSGQLSGSAVVTVAYAPARIKLVNTSPFNVTLSSGTVQAGLVLTQIY